MAKYIDNRFYALEIGTHSLKLIAGDYNDDGTVDIIEHAEVQTVKKVEKGQILDIDEIQDFFTKASTRLENTTNEEIHRIVVSVSGPHIATRNQRGTLAIEAEDGIITDADVIAASKHARSFRLPDGKEAITILDRAFIIDEVQMVSNPAKMVGNKLEAEVHVIYGEKNILDTLKHFFLDQFGPEFPFEFSFAGISSFFGVTEEHEQKEGALCIDIGYGTTDYAIYKDKICQHTGSFTIGCKHLINDLHVALELPFAKCKPLLEQCGAAKSKGDGRSRMVKVKLLDNKERNIPQSSIEQVVEMRLRELFGLIKRDLAENGVDNTFSSGVVLCGGGAKIEGIDILAQEEFKCPARIGHPVAFSGDKKIISNPSFANVCGSLRVAYLFENIEEARHRSTLSDFSASIKKAWQEFVGALNF